MKQFGLLILAAVLGGLITIGGSQLLKNSTTEINPLSKTVGFENDAPAGINVPFDFVEAADKAKPVVVQIRAKESEVLAKQRRQEENQNNPFGRMFEDDFFQDFFGGQMFGPRTKRGSGSGVIFSKDGYIVTNNHVVGFADEIEVTTFDGKVYDATKVGTDKSTDLAVLKIEGKKDFPTLEIADSDKAKVGEWVLAVGNPFEYLTSTVTAGIISAKGRDIDIINDQKAIEEFIQTDAAINPGNSGGALVDAKGRLLGINTAIATPTGTFTGYSFAIPMELVLRTVKDIMENGDIERTSLGINIYEISDDFAKDNNLEINRGLFVAEVQNRSSAQFAGIIPNDIIIGVNGKSVETYDALKEELKFTKVGDVLSIDIVRNGEQKTIPVRLKTGL
ncbi:MAG: trypsin-like peptidase domain-containing protein [Bacteroidota bacterium]